MHACGIAGVLSWGMGLLCVTQCVRVRQSVVQRTGGDAFITLAGMGSPALCLFSSSGALVFVCVYLYMCVLVLLLTGVGCFLRLQLLTWWLICCCAGRAGMPAALGTLLLLLVVVAGALSGRLVMKGQRRAAPAALCWSAGSAEQAQATGGCWLC